jgi:hypothetical protein
MPDADGVGKEPRREILLGLKDSLDKLTETFTRSADRSVKGTELSFRLNEQIIALNEKWMLLDGGTIALSLGFIGSIVSRDGHVPKHPFEWLVCPAWFLLLLSMYCCWVRMTSIHNLNVASLRVMAADTTTFGLQGLSITINRIIVEANSAVDRSLLNAEITTALKNLTGSAAMVSEEIKKNQEASLAAQHDSAKRSAVSGPYEHAAKLMTGLALVLLCAFAIKAIPVL